jgi:hypothetical protein
MADMVQAFVEDLMILAHTSRPPSAAEWAEYVAAVGSRDPTKLRTLVFTDGGAPTSTQRKELNAVLGGRASRGAIVSASLMVRGAVSALGWFNPLIKAFAPTEVDDALQYLGVPPEQVPLVWGEVRRLREKLGGDSKSIQQA